MGAGCRPGLTNSTGQPNVYFGAYTRPPDLVAPALLTCVVWLCRKRAKSASWIFAKQPILSYEFSFPTSSPVQVHQRPSTRYRGNPPKRSPLHLGLLSQDS